MAFIATTRRPQSLIIDRSHPLTIGLLSYAVPVGNTMVDLWRPRAKGSPGTASISQYGSAVATQEWIPSGADSSDLNWTSGAFTVAAWANYTTILGYPGAIDRSTYVSESNNQGWYLNINQGSGKYGFGSFNNNAEALNLLKSTTTATTGPVMQAGTSDGTTRRIFINGVQEASTTNSPVPASRSSNVVASTVGTLNYAVGIWRRALTAMELFEWYIKPFDLLQQPTARRYYFGTVVAGGGGGFQAAWARGSNVVLNTRIAA